MRWAWTGLAKTVPKIRTPSFWIYPFAAHESCSSFSTHLLHGFALSTVEQYTADTHFLQHPPLSPYRSRDAMSRVGFPCTPTPTPTDSWSSYFDSWEGEDKKVPVWGPVIVDDGQRPDRLNVRFNLDFEPDWDVDLQDGDRYSPMLTASESRRLNDVNRAHARRQAMVSYGRHAAAGHRVRRPDHDVDSPRRVRPWPARDPSLSKALQGQMPTGRSPGTSAASPRRVQARSREAAAAATLLERGRGCVGSGLTKCRVSERASEQPSDASFCSKPTSPPPSAPQATPAHGMAWHGMA